MEIQILESTSLGEKNGTRYNARLIVAGQGSSGFYSEAMLQEYGPAAFPAGTHVYVNHSSYDEQWNRPERDVRDIAGVLESDAEFKDGALYSTIKFTTEGARLVGELAEAIGLSISAQGESEEVGEGVMNITKLLPHVYNSVDLVTRAGAGGKVLELLESFREKSDKLVTTNVALEGAAHEREPMTEEDLKKITEAIASAIEALKESLTAAPEPENADEAAGEPDLVAATEAALEADLPKMQRAKVVEAVKAGASIEDAVKEQKDFRDAILKDVQTVTEGARASDAGGNTPSRVNVPGWDN